ncbi:MAG: flagellin [Pseudomonadota bacterium]
MFLTNLGDLSSSITTRRQTVALRDEISKLSQELSTGRVSDLRDVLAGSYSTLTDIDRRMAVLDGYNTATTEATIYASNAQLALDNYQSFGNDLALSLITTGTSPSSVAGTDTAAEARNALAGMVGQMNTRVAGRFLFSGTATDQPPIAAPQRIIDELRTALVTAGVTAPDDIFTEAQNWFDDPAGFEALIYQGSADSLGPFPLSQAETVALDVKALDPNLRQVLMYTALAALTDDAAFGFDVPAQGEMFRRTGEALLLAQDDVITLRADVGFVEARIDKVITRNEAELSSLEFARAALLEVDPFEAATKLEAAQFQLQSLYTVTARNSQLRLVNFL